MTTLTLRDIRDCLDGAFPSLIATCAADGTPNVSALSDACYVDQKHLALSFQFFNKTRTNVLGNSRAMLQLTHPRCGTRYTLPVRYLRTETEGALFERMKARLAGIASHVGMGKVFRLRGADVYEVLEVQHVAGEPPLPASSDFLGALRHSAEVLRDCVELQPLLESAMDLLEHQLNFSHSLILLGTATQGRLFTVASRGYTDSGVGAEIGYGEGVIGVAAQAATPIRITHLASDYLYGQAVRDAYLAKHPGLDLETRIPLPGLPESRSQLAVPIVDGGRVHGVVYVERTQDSSISYDHEDALVVFTEQLARQYAAVVQREARGHMTVLSAPAEVADPGAGPAMMIAHDNADRSVFIDGEYLIKGVAGAILWRMLGEYVHHRRRDFTNRELRRDASLGLPEVGDNLEARLVLLQKRLAERTSSMRLEKVGRGRYRLRVSQPLELDTD